MKVPAGLAMNSYVNVSPGWIGSCVTSGTPSIALGTSTPCQWIVVGSDNSFFTMILTWSPSVTRIIGPGTVPL